MGLFRPFYPQIGEFGWSGPESTSEIYWCTLPIGAWSFSFFRVIIFNTPQFLFLNDKLHIWKFCEDVGYEEVQLVIWVGWIRYGKVSIQYIVIYIFDPPQTCLLIKIMRQHTDRGLFGGGKGRVYLYMIGMLHQIMILLGNRD